MKKSYIKPETLEVKFEAQGVIAASIQMFNDAEPVDTSEDGTQLTNKNGWSSSNWY